MPMAYGVKKVKLEGGKTVEMANVIRYFKKSRGKDIRTNLKATFLMDFENRWRFCAAKKQGKKLRDFQNL